MLSISQRSSFIKPNSSKDTEFNRALAGESKSERVLRIYRSAGGPLIGSLFDEAHRRGHEPKDMAVSLGVSFGYINQLRSGIRKSEDISQDFADACGGYLGYQTIVVKLLAGNIRMSDFLNRAETEEAAIDRGIRHMMADAKVRTTLPDVSQLACMPLQAKRALVLLYSEVSSSDIFNTRELPNIVFWLQKAAIAHDSNEAEAM